MVSQPWLQQGCSHGAARHDSSPPNVPLRPHPMCPFHPSPMPQNHFLIATKTISAEVYVFDYSKHPSKPAAGAHGWWRVGGPAAAWLPARASQPAQLAV